MPVYARVCEFRGILKSLGSSDLDDDIQLETVRCLRVLLNTAPGFERLLHSPSLVHCLACSLYTQNYKLGSLVAEVLAAICVVHADGHQLVLSALSDFSAVYEEKYRFQYLIESLKNTEDDVTQMDEVSRWEYSTLVVTLINAIIDGPELVEDRVFLREEFSRRGLAETFSVTSIFSF